ncbi:MAG: NADP-binding protein [Spirochaetes bacterium]|nr:NADP-binding protein [Spirochaetota bacterium]
MKEKVKIAVLGTGHMGSGIIQLLLKKEGIELCGVYGKRKERSGQDVGEILGLANKTGVKINHDLDAVLATGKPDIVIQATSSRMSDAETEILKALDQGANIISIAEEASYPFYGSPEIGQRIDEKAIQKGLTVLGTGINPGFVLDLLIIALSGCCFEVDRIKASRVNDLSPYGYNVLTTQGVNMLPEDFYKGVEDGSVVGHFGFPESMNMIAKALGWEIERIEQERIPIISNVERDGGEVGTIKSGYTAGCKHIGKAYDKNNKLIIELIHPQQVHPEAEGQGTGDYIEIYGTPDIKISTGPEIPGGIGTIALAVNMIPQVIMASAGYKTMADLPVPAAIMNDVRKLIK